MMTMMMTTTMTMTMTTREGVVEVGRHRKLASEKFGAKQKATVGG